MEEKNVGPAKVKGKTCGIKRNTVVCDQKKSFEIIIHGERKIKIIILSKQGGAKSLRESVLEVKKVVCLFFFLFLRK